MSAAVLEQPPVPPPVPTEDALVRAWRIDRTIDFPPDELPEGWTLEAIRALDEGPAYYAEKHADQAWAHVSRWAREVPGTVVTVSLEEITWAEWRDAMLGEADEVSPQ